MMRIAMSAVCMVLGMWWVSSAIAGPSPDIPSAYVVASEDNGIPPEVLYAVAMTESKMSLEHTVRPWPWTLNVGGKGYRYDTRNEACSALRSFLQQTRVVDVGIAQMNVRWQTQVFGPGKRFADPCAGLDPYANLDEAAKVIRQHYDASGDWVVAAGRYHRPAGGAPAARYRRKVREELAQLGASPTLGTDSAELMLAHTASSHHPAPSLSTPSVPANDANLTWITPSPRSPEFEVTWVTPEPRRWMAEVAVASR
ncbi:transglycosylase SLT domain-containing protein [Halomonas elongata]|uniref:transglycosylase SLT domain-containing protein n=1 Tax=Halomonas elongata TaxID=2746 RepID=UPI0023B0F4AA|nr:transglycosylase SLT domain-containing protein [Halomonas elongata]